MLEQNPVNDPDYEHFLELLQLSNEEVLTCLEPEVKFLSESFSSNEVDRVEVGISVAIIRGCTRVGCFYVF